jgi:hypothetical protein
MALVMLLGVVPTTGVVVVVVVVAALVVLAEGGFCSLTSLRSLGSVPDLFFFLFFLGFSVLISVQVPGPRELR